MQILITGKQIDIGDSLREYSEEKVSAVITKYFDTPMGANISFSKEGANIRCDISTHPSSGVLVQGSGSAGDAYGAFDEANIRIGKQLSKYKERFTEYNGVENEKASMTIFEAEDEDAQTEAASMVIAEMEYYIPTCTVNVAVLRMDLSDQNALLFRNIKDNKLNMVYRRKDGNIGWIDPSNI